MSPQILFLNPPLVFAIAFGAALWAIALQPKGHPTAGAALWAIAALLTRKSERSRYSQISNFVNFDDVNQYSIGE